MERCVCVCVQAYVHFIFYMTDLHLTDLHVYFKVLRIYVIMERFEEQNKKLNNHLNGTSLVYLETFISH